MVRLNLAWLIIIPLCAASDMLDFITLNSHSSYKAFYIFY